MQQALLSLSSLLSPHISEIKTTKAHQCEGLCAFCALQNTKGYKAVELFKELKLFTRYSDLELYGDVVCFECFKVFRYQKVRSRHWVVTAKKWQLLQREDILAILLHPPEDPWALYLTESHKKHGWIRGMYAINYDNSNIQLIHEDFVLQTSLLEIKALADIIQRLLDGGYSKTQIRGKWSAMALNRLMETPLFSAYLELEQYCDTNLLHVILYISTK